MEESSLICKVNSLIQSIFEPNEDPFLQYSEDDENDIFVYLFIINLFLMF
jgi:hypothetical protein